MHVEEKQNAVVVHMTAVKIRDEQTIKRYGMRLDETLAEIPAGKRIVLDFTKVETMSSAMMRRLVIFKKHCEHVKVELRLRNLCPPLKDVFKMTRLDTVFRIGEGNFGEEENDD